MFHVWLVSIQVPGLLGAPAHAGSARDASDPAAHNLSPGVSFVVRSIGRVDAYYRDRDAIEGLRCWVGDKGLNLQSAGWHSGAASCVDGVDRFFYQVKVDDVQDCVEPLGGLGGPGAIWVPCGAVEGDGDADLMATPVEDRPRYVIPAPATPARDAPARTTPARPARTTPRAPQVWPDLVAAIQDSAAASRREGVNDAAVVVAIEDYLDVEDVTGARANADAWVRWLGQTRGVPAARILRAYDREGSPERGGRSGHRGAGRGGGARGYVDSRRCHAHLRLAAGGRARQARVAA